MKKYLLFLISLLLSTGIAYSQTQIKKQRKIIRDNTILRDNFESYADGENFATPGRWGITIISQGGEGYVTDEMSHNGNKSILLIDPDHNGVHSVNCDWYVQNVPQMKRYSLEIWVRPVQNNVQLTALKIGYHAGGQWGGGGAIAAIQFWSNGKIGYTDGINGNVVLNTNWVAGQWHHLKMILIHSTQHWKFYVNNELIAENLAYMHHQADLPNRITFKVSGGSAYWDDVKFTAVPLIQRK